MNFQPSSVKPKQSMIVIASLRSAQTCYEPSTHNIDVDELNELGIDVPTQLIRKIIRVGAISRSEQSRNKSRKKRLRK